MTENYIGVDVSKNWIDVFDRELGSCQIAMQANALNKFELR